MVLESSLGLYFPNPSTLIFNATLTSGSANLQNARPVSLFDAPGPRTGRAYSAAPERR
jgi:hypothetical protein